MRKLRVLDLFSGIGGFSLGLERTGGFETAAFCEYAEFPRKVLAKHWPEIPCFPDVRELKGTDIDGPIDVICGGYPCQPFSTAGKRQGKEDDRHLWPEFMRLVVELRPAWVIGENVSGHISMGLDDVLADLEAEGYACRTFVIPACAVGAPHRRDRVWTVAHANEQRLERCRGIREVGSVTARDFSAKGGENVFAANSDNDDEQRISREQRAQEKQPVFGKCGNPVAHSPQLQRDGGGEHRQPDSGQVSELGKRSGAQLVADAERLGQSRQGEHVVTRDCAAEGQGQTDHAFSISQPEKWFPEPDVGQLADGVSRRLVGGHLDADTGWLQVSRAQNAQECLRGLRLYRETLRTSQERKLEGQQSLQYQDALFFVSHVIASQAGRPRGKEVAFAVHRLWEAVLSRKSAALQHAPDEIKALWESLPSEAADWAIVAACHGCFWSEWGQTPRVANGVPSRVDRLKALGNAVVPQIPELIGRAILAAESAT